MKTVQKIKKLITKAEERKTKLQSKIERLKEEAEALRQAKENDLQEAILNDGKVNHKLAKDLNAVHVDIQEAQQELSQVDTVVVNQFEQLKGKVVKERNQFVKEHGEKTFYPLFDELNEIKLAYLEKLAEFSEKKHAYNVEYRRQFQEVERRLKLPYHDPRDDHSLNPNRRFQDNKCYSPIVLLDELQNALHKRRVLPITQENRDKYKK